MTLATNRWLVAGAGVLVMMSLGTIYSWSLFTQPLIASFGWSNTATTWTFALATLFLSLGALVGGRWQDRAGPRVVTLTGVALWGAGNLLAGIGTPTWGMEWMYLTYGVLGGFGAGMGYITPVATVTKWFPERRGLGSGIVVMGFGLGGFFYNLVVKSIPEFDAAAIAAAEYARAARLDPNAATLSPAEVQAVMNVFVWSGIAFLGIGCSAALLLTSPAHASAARLIAVPDEERSYTTPEMLRTPQFYLLWSMLFLNVTAGILVVANAVPIMQELTGSAPKVLATAFGVVCIANAIGRLFWGAVSDWIGRSQAYHAIFGIQAGVFFLLGGSHEMAMVVAAYALVLLCYGGVFGTMPSFNADYFGTRHMGSNYGALLTAWGAAGLVGPLFAAYVKDATGSFSGALPVVAIMLVAAMLLPLAARKPTAELSAAATRPA